MTSISKNSQYAWVQKFCLNSLVFSDPVSGLKDNPLGLVSLNVLNQTMSQVSNINPHRLTLSEALVKAARENKSWVVDNRYNLFPAVLGQGSVFSQLNELDENRITVFKVGRYQKLASATIKSETDLSVTNLRDVHEEHGGLYYIGKNIRGEVDANTISLYLEYIGFSNFPATYTRYPYPVYILHHPTWDDKFVHRFTSHLDYANINVVVAKDNIRHVHEQIISGLGVVPALIIDSDFVPIVQDWLFPKVSIEDEAYVNIWQTVNVLNGLTYGHGGPKLIGKGASIDSSVEEGSTATIDMVDTTANYYYARGLKTRDIVGFHNFSHSDFASWRTGFREGFKLCLTSLDKSSDLVYRQQAEQRLNTWCGLLNGDNCELHFTYKMHWALGDTRFPALDETTFKRRKNLSIQGATEGRNLAIGRPDQYRVVNDYSGMESLYNKFLKEW